MELEKVTAEIRPRTAWEAIDLGISLVRAHALSLLKGWMASAYPFCLVILALSWNSLGWGVFLIWWLKPVFERVALHPLSRSLFGEHPTWRDTMKVLPSELRKNKTLVLMGVVLAVIGALIGMMDDREARAGMSSILGLTMIGLFFYRSGLSRSLILPVKYLEGLDGARSKSRMQVLSLRSSGSAVSLTFICLLMELGLFASQLWFFYMMLPEGVEMGAVFFTDGWFDIDTEALPKWLWMMLALFYLNALTIVAWFYTGGGFGLYVNTRTWTEGWDIELKFKGLGQRLGLILIALCLIGSAPTLEANGEVNVAAEQVLAGEEFEVKTREVFKDQKGEDQDDEQEGDSRSSDYGIGIFAGIGNMLFWGIMTVLVGGVIWVIIRNLHLFGKGEPRGLHEAAKKVKTVAGMNVEPENLPPHLLQVARGLWDDGRHQEALGLLYRGAISSLMTHGLVEIEESDTEMDCLQRVLAKGEVANASYFKTLTGAWMSQAYAKRLPDDEVLAQLWGQWPYPERRGA